MWLPAPAAGLGYVVVRLPFSQPFSGVHSTGVKLPVLLTESNSSVALKSIE